jgi:hypothetical protein
MGALGAFCDETGTHDDAQIIGVGGYFFDENGQKQFTESCYETMRPFRDRGIDYFHVGDCDSKYGKEDTIQSQKESRL